MFVSRAGKGSTSSEIKGRLWNSSVVSKEKTFEMGRKKNGLWKQVWILFEWDGVERL